MKGSLIDTGVAVDHLRGDLRATGILRELFSAESHVFMSVLTKAEIRAGIKSVESEQIERFLELFVSVPIDDDVAEVAGKLAWKSRRSNPELGIVDYMIAAQAIRGDFALVTTNVERYPIIEGLLPAYDGREARHTEE